MSTGVKPPKGGSLGAGESDLVDALSLHQLADNETTPQERAQILAALAADKALKAQACELSQQKDLIKAAYAQVCPPVSRGSRPGSGRVAWMALAACLVIALSSVLAWLGYQGEDGPKPKGIGGERVVLLDPDGSAQALAQVARDETRIVFQVSDPQNTATSDVLDQVESVLLAYRQQNKPLRVELVANGNGLSILREGLSQDAERIEQMGEEYPNLAFIACQNTAQRIANNQGFPVSLLPQVRSIPSGVGHIAKRQAEGWVYIHI